MTQVGEAFVAIRPDTTQFAGQARQGILKPMATIAGAIGGIFAAQAVGRWLGDAFTQANEAQKVARQTEAVIRSTGGAANVTADQVGTLADKLSALAGVDDEAAQAALNWLLTFKNIQNVGADKIFDRTAQAATDLAAALGAKSGTGTEANMATAAQMLGRALNDPLAGLSALTRAGVQFTDQQKDQITWLVATGDLLGAQKIILGEVESQVRGSAKAQATSADKAKVAYENLKEAIGTALLPIVEALADALTPVAEWLTKNKDAAMVLAGVITGALLAAIAAYTIAMAQAAVATIAATWPVLLIAAGVLALVAVVVAFYTKWDEIWNWIKDHPAYAAIIAVLLLFIAPILLVGAAIGALAANWDAIWGWIKQAAEDAWNFLRDNVFTPLQDAANTLWMVASAAFGGVVEAFNAIGTGLQWAYDNIIKPVIELFETALDTILGIVESIADALSLGGPTGGTPVPGVAPTRAAGGTVERGRTYRFVEHGAELFTPGRTGRLTSTRDLAMLLGRAGGDGSGGPELREAARDLSAAAAVLADAAVPGVADGAFANGVH